MIGSEHYAEAERLIDDSARLVEDATPNTIDERLPYVDRLLARAQVHATLALAAATKSAQLASGRGGLR